MVSDPDVVYGQSIIKRNRAERKVLGIKRTSSPARPTKSSSAPPVAPRPEAAPESDIVREILQEREESMQVPKTAPKADILQEVLADIPPIKIKPTKEVVKKKATKKKATTKKKTARGKNKKVEELNQDELSDLFTGGSNTSSDDDDE
jgi:hypothetical protein